MITCQFLNIIVEFHLDDLSYAVGNKSLLVMRVENENLCAFNRRDILIQRDLKGCNANYTGYVNVTNNDMDAEISPI